MQSRFVRFRSEVSSSPDGSGLESPQESLLRPTWRARVIGGVFKRGVRCQGNPLLKS